MNNEGDTDFSIKQTMRNDSKDDETEDNNNVETE
jgi:hypothetical protein